MEKVVLNRDDSRFPLELVSIGMGLGSILILCIPFVGYAAILLGSFGVLSGAYALFVSLRDRNGSALFALAGIGTCLLALLLVLLPYLRTA
jgi:hypothetical protein